MKGPPPTNLISPPFCSAGPQFLFHRQTCLQKEMEGEGRIPAKGRNNLSNSFHVKRYVGRDEFLITSSVLLHSRCKKVGRLNSVRALAECILCFYTRPYYTDEGRHSRQQTVPTSQRAFLMAQRSFRFSCHVQSSDFLD